MSSVPLLIAGDFNIHVDVPGNADSVCLKELLESMGLQQHVNVPTHESGLPGFDHYSTMRLLIS